ncbi:GntR family transcriptional regulator [Microbacterium sp. DT81.1]|uniref:GntR family transcriptional regulator n=1 Tax=Microbacterium sp. DT81.1 TaxID=3393413 RepID=UPI003CE9F4BB
MTDSNMRGSGSQFAYTEVRRRILDMDLKPGTRLFEESLAASLGVSRTPLREALRQLVSERLLERQPTGGLAVPVLDSREIWELYDCRAALEGLMTGEAALIATEDDITELDGIVARNAALVDFPDEAMRFGKALHTAIAEIAANAWALRLHDQVTSQMERYRRYTNNSPARRHVALEQHRRLVESIRARDSAEASQRAFDHVIGARDEALRAIGSVDLHK